MNWQGEEWEQKRLEYNGPPKFTSVSIKIIGSLTRWRTRSRTIESLAGRAMPQRVLDYEGSVRK